jgi:hypothetical protein
MADNINEVLEALTGTGGSEQIKELVEALKELAQGMTELGISYKSLGESGKGVNNALDAAAKNTSKWSQSAEGLGQQLGTLGGVLQNADNTFLGFAGRLVESASGAENATFSIGNFTKGLKSSINVANIFATVGTQMGQSMLALAVSTDKAMVKFNEATGAADMYGSQMIGLQRDLQAVNVDIGEMGQAYTGLVNNLGSFNRMSATQQKTIAKNTAVLQELGVSANVTAANYNTLMSAFAMTEDQASKVQREMFVLAQTIGMPPEAMAEGFQQALPQLAAFGKRSTDVYKKLAVNAKAAGMEVGQLLKITEQFDTFEGAAQAVGKLNALLGGPYLSTTRMIQQTDPTERMRMLSSAINDAGKSFDEMEYYERKATAAALGLADVSELALLMNNRFDLLEPQVKQSASDLEALAEQTAKFNEVGEILKNMLMSLVANLYPVINTIKEAAGRVSAFIAMYPSFKLVLAGLTVGFGALAIAVGAVTGPVGITIVVLTTLITVFSLVYSYIGSFNDILNETSASVKVLKIMLLTAFAVPIVIIGIIYTQIMLLKTAFETIMDILEYFQPTIDAFLQPFFDRIEPVISHLVSFISSLRESEAAMLGLKVIALAFAAPLIAVFALVAAAIGLVLAPVYLLLEAFSFLYTFFIIGQSPSFVDAVNMVIGVFGALGKAISSPIRAVESLFGVMKDFVSFLLSPEVMDVLGGIFETGVNLVAGAFGFDAENEANQISQARLEVEQALADSNVALKNSIDQLTKVMSEGNTKGSGTVVSIDPKMEKFFDVQEKRIERKMSGRPVYSTTGGR